MLVRMPDLPFSNIIELAGPVDLNHVMLIEPVLVYASGLAAGNVTANEHIREVRQQKPVVFEVVNKAGVN